MIRYAVGWYDCLGDDLSHSEYQVTTSSVAERGTTMYVLPSPSPDQVPEMCMNERFRIWVDPLPRAGNVPVNEREFYPQSLLDERDGNFVFGLETSS